MRWRLLAAALGAILVAAILFSLLGSRPDPIGTPDVAPVEGAGPAWAAQGPGPGEPAPGTPPPRSAQSPPAGVGLSAAPDGKPMPATTPPAPAYPSTPTPLPQASSDASADAGLPFQVNKDGIKSAIGQKIPELRDCYESWLEANPSLAGRIKVSFTIAEDPETGLGGVTEIGVLDGGMDHFAMQGCVMNVLKDLHFEAPTGPVKVNYPLSFATRDAGD
ncbi:MAG: hypothetical protein AMXMBFR34_41240 [Myxococcaceae bacterium]